MKRLLLMAAFITVGYFVLAVLTLLAYLIDYTPIDVLLVIIAGVWLVFYSLLFIAVAKVIMQDRRANDST